MNGGLESVETDTDADWLLQEDSKIMRSSTVHFASTLSFDAAQTNALLSLAARLISSVTEPKGTLTDAMRQLRQEMQSFLNPGSTGGVKFTLEEAEQILAFFASRYTT